MIFLLQKVKNYYKYDICSHGYCSVITLPYVLILIQVHTVHTVLRTLRSHTEG